MKKHVQNFYKTFAIAAIVTLILAGCEGSDLTGPTDARDNYLGSWTATENPGPNQTTFPVTITKDVNNSDRIFLANFNNLGGSIKPYGVVNGNSVTIPSQLISGNTMSGSGTYNSGNQTISLSYTVNDGNGDVSYTATLSQ